MTTRLPTLVVHRSRGASALIVVYWVIALLSLLVFTTAQLLIADFRTQAAAGQRARAFELAEMGIAIASHPGVKPGEDALRQVVSDFESFEATIEAENGRLNLNAILRRGDTEVLYRLFEIWGLPRADAQPIVDSLIDWVDADDDRSPDGAESEAYLRSGAPGFPPNRAFGSMHEVHGVMNIEILSAVRPDWERSFTLFGDSRLALDDASPEAIAATCGCTLGEAASFVSFRQGRDGIENSEDDPELDSVQQALDVIGASYVERETIESRVTIGGSTLRLRSVGRMGDVSAEREIVVARRGPGMRVLAAYARSIQPRPPTSPR